ncbi:PREDICTED: uncharacterized protein LOC108569974 [Nicrophorus vespilloides]|uniref:Uncharacterized protein LOC108569974 n=1 Tax=Nicrophorus vespilloides TaxID=110193 RepID=A0ABM1NKB2_NICVS|nr:PREDICTED: uncharacterized protein LOC108569974 [Nicrophorus vespilloides]
MQLHWTLCFLLSALFAESCGYVMIEPSNSEAGEGNCLSKSYPLGTLKHGEKSFVEDECLEATCLSDGTINYEGCKLLRLQDNCKFVESDKTLSFPECCKKIICD